MNLPDLSLNGIDFLVDFDNFTTSYLSKYLPID